MEKAYRVMRNSGAGNIAIGIILLVTGVTVGIISIINGASLLKHKNNNILKRKSPRSLFIVSSYVRSEPAEGTFFFCEGVRN